MILPVLGQATPNGGFWGKFNFPYIYSIPSDLKCADTQALGTMLGPEATHYGVVSLDFIADFFQNIKGFNKIKINATAVGHRPRFVTLPSFCFPGINEFVFYTDTNVIEYDGGMATRLFSGNREPCAMTNFAPYDYMKTVGRFPDLAEISSGAVFQVDSFSVPVQQTSIPDPSTEPPPGCSGGSSWPTFQNASSLPVEIKFSTGNIGYYNKEYWESVGAPGPYNSSGWTFRAAMLIGPRPYYRAMPPNNNPVINPLGFEPFGNWFNSAYDYRSGFFTIITAKGNFQIPVYGPTFEFSIFSGSMTAVY